MNHLNVTISGGKSGTIHSYCEETLCNVREFSTLIKVPPFDGEEQEVGLSKLFCPLCGKNPAKWWSWEPLGGADELDTVAPGDLEQDA